MSTSQRSSISTKPPSEHHHAQPEKEREEKAPTPQEIQQYRRKITRLYTQYSPEKLDLVEIALRRYQYHLPEFLQAVEDACAEIDRGGVGLPSIGKGNSSSGTLTLAQQEKNSSSTGKVSPVLNFSSLSSSQRQQRIERNSKQRQRNVQQREAQEKEEKECSEERPNKSYIVASPRELYGDRLPPIKKQQTDNKNGVVANNNKKEEKERKKEGGSTESKKKNRDNSPSSSPQEEDLSSTLRQRKQEQQEEEEEKKKKKNANRFVESHRERLQRLRSKYNSPSSYGAADDNVSKTEEESTKGTKKSNNNNNSTTALPPIQQQGTSSASSCCSSTLQNEKKRNNNKVSIRIQHEEQRHRFFEAEKRGRFDISDQSERRFHTLQQQERDEYQVIFEYLLFQHNNELKTMQERRTRIKILQAQRERERKEFLKHQREERESCVEKETASRMEIVKAEIFDRSEVFRDSVKNLADVFKTAVRKEREHREEVERRCQSDIMQSAQDQEELARFREKLVQRAAEKKMGVSVEGKNLKDRNQSRLRNSKGIYYGRILPSSSLSCSSGMKTVSPERGGVESVVYPECILQRDKVKEQADEMRRQAKEKKEKERKEEEEKKAQEEKKRKEEVSRKQEERRKQRKEDAEKRAKMMKPRMQSKERKKSKQQSESAAKKTSKKSTDDKQKTKEEVQEENWKEDWKEQFPYSALLKDVSTSCREEAELGTEALWEQLFLGLDTSTPPQDGEKNKTRKKKSRDGDNISTTIEKEESATSPHTKDHHPCLQLLREVWAEEKYEEMCPSSIIWSELLQKRKASEKKDQKEKEEEGRENEAKDSSCEPSKKEFPCIALVREAAVENFLEKQKNKKEEKEKLHENVFDRLLEVAGEGEDSEEKKPPSRSFILLLQEVSREKRKENLAGASRLWTSVVSCGVEQKEKEEEKKAEEEKKKEDAKRKDSNKKDGDSKESKASPSEEKTSHEDGERKEEKETDEKKEESSSKEEKEKLTTSSEQEKEEEGRSPARSEHGSISSSSSCSSSNFPFLSLLRDERAVEALQIDSEQENCVCFWSLLCDLAEQQQGTEDDSGSLKHTQLVRQVKANVKYQTKHPDCSYRVLMRTKNEPTTTAEEKEEEGRSSARSEHGSISSSSSCPSSNFPFLSLLRDERAVEALEEQFEQENCVCFWSLLCDLAEQETTEAAEDDGISDQQKEEDHRTNTFKHTQLVRQVKANVNYQTKHPDCSYRVLMRTKNEPTTTAEEEEEEEGKNNDSAESQQQKGDEKTSDYAKKQEKGEQSDKKEENSISAAATQPNERVLMFQKVQTLRRHIIEERMHRRVDEKVYEKHQRQEAELRARTFLEEVHSVKKQNQQRHLRRERTMVLSGVGEQIVVSLDGKYYVRR